MTDLDLDRIQGFVVRGYRLPVAGYIFLRIDDPAGAAAWLARQSRCVILLKGASSLVAAPSGGITVNPTGTPLMATAGSGDVLSGAIGAYLAGGLEAEEAAIAPPQLRRSRR